MSQISQKSISGITSITTPTGIDNQFTLHINDTSEALKLDHAGNIHIHNHVNTTGISSASNFKTGTSDLHSAGLNVAYADVDDFVDVGSNIKLGNAGVITATSFVGDGSDLTNLPAGLGTALSATATSPLNKMYYTNQVLGVPSSITVDVPASASKAYTQYADIKVESSADLIIAEGDDLIPDVLGLADFGTFGGGATAGRIRVNSISNAANDGSPTVQKGLVVTGVTTSTTFSGSGASLTNLNASNIASGTVPTARLGSGTANSSTFLAGDSTFKTVTGTTINSNADNRIITGSGTANTLNGESTLTYSGDTLLSTNSNFVIKSIDTNASNAENRIQFNAGKMFYETDMNGVVGSSSHIFSVDGSEKFRITSGATLSLAGDTDTYIHHPEDNEIAITVSGGSFPIVRFGTGGSNSTVGFSTDSTLVTNSERISVRGFSSFKSTSNVYAAIYTHNEGNTSGTYNAHLLWNAGGANRGGIGYMPNTGEVVINNQNALNFATGATNLGGTTRLRINSSGHVTIPAQPYLSMTVSNNLLSGNYMTHNSVLTNNGTHYNTSNSRFVCPVAGYYFCSIMVMSNNNSQTMDLELHKNGSNANNILVPYNASTGGSYNQVSGTCIIQCAANDYLQFKLNSGSVYSGRHSNISFALFG